MDEYKDRPLIGYIPTVLKDVREFSALMSAEQPEIFSVFEGLQNVLNNLFVTTSTVYGVERWEKLLNITPKATYTLDERKFTILSRLAEELPYTLRMLERILTELCGADGFKITLNYDSYTIIIMVALTSVNKIDDIKAMAYRVIPANLTQVVSIEYNQWYKLEPYTWDSFATKTWDQARTEVLD